MRLTSIMYSLENSAELLSLIKLGVDILHLDLEKIPKATALDLISVIRDLECKSKGRPIAIALELRTRAPTTGLTEKISGDQHEFFLSTGSMVLLTSDDQYANKCSSETIYINHPFLHDIKPQMKIYLDSRNIILECSSVKTSIIVCKIEKGGKLMSLMDVLIPGIQATSPHFNSNDIADIKMAYSSKVDILIVPEATPSKVQTIRDNARERRVPMIFARISLIQNFKDFKRILKVVDGVVLSPEPMLPELAAANILIYMNTIVESCKKYCRNTIFVAHNNSGVYNAAGSASCVSSLYGALGCGVDCVSISPNAIVEVEATIKFLCSVCRMAEINHNITSHYLFGTIVGYKPSTTALAECARLLAYCTNSSCVLQLSNCVPTAKALSAARLHCPVVVPVTNKKESNYDRHLIKFASLAGLLTLNRLFLILCEADSKDTVNQLSVMKYDSEVIEMLKTSH